MLPDKVVTGRMEKRGEAPRVSKSNKMGLAGKKINIQDPELGDLLSCHRGLVQTGALLGRKY